MAQAYIINKQVELVQTRYNNNNDIEPILGMEHKCINCINTYRIVLQTMQNMLQRLVGASTLNSNANLSIRYSNVDLYKKEELLTWINRLWKVYDTTITLYLGEL